MSFTYYAKSSSGVRLILFTFLLLLPGIFDARTTTYDRYYDDYAYPNVPNYEDDDPYFEESYTVPAACLSLPVCDIQITSSTIGACYFDPADNTSKAELEVCVAWSNRPGTENIVVAIDGPPKQMTLITTTGASGSACVKFIIPANGVYNAGVWVYF